MYRLISFIASVMLLQLSPQARQDIQRQIDSLTNLLKASEAVNEQTKPSGTWRIIEEKDEFGRPSGASHLMSKYSHGRFSNSATTDSELIAAVRSSEKYAWICLLEYGDQVVRTNSAAYSINVLDDSGNVQHFNGIGRGSYIEIAVTLGGLKPRHFIEMLRSNKQLQFSIRDGYLSEYHFTVECTGFDELYKALWPTW
ncbi:MAG: hypothetical protein MJY60_04060 [Bacteroidales bacterium]|nr:hypothetical protein [Bacteroidales bacterium]